MIVGGLEGSLGLAGIEALLAGLLHLGFSKDGLAEFEQELKIGKSLLLVHGGRDQVTRDKDVLSDAGFAAVPVRAE